MIQAARRPAAAAGILGAVAAVLAKASQGCMSLEGSVWAKPLCMLLGYGLMLCANAGMTTLFVRSLQRLPSLQATVISNAANMAATGLLGHLLFAEHITPHWALGIALVISGLLLISRSVISSAPGQPHPQQQSTSSKQGQEAAKKLL